MFTQSVPPNFKPVGAGAICFCEWRGRILALRRSEKSYQGGKWTGAPGGKVEKGEDPLDAAVRETLEETGLNIPKQLVRKLGIFYAQFPDTEYILHVFHVALEHDPGPISINPSEHTEFRWIYPREVLSLPLMRGGLECLSALYPDCQHDRHDKES